MSQGVEIILIIVAVCLLGSLIAAGCALYAQFGVTREWRREKDEEQWADWQS